MNRKRGASTLLAGYTVEDLLSIDPADFLEMSEAFQTQAVSRLASAANKRLARVKKAGVSDYSPAAQRSGALDKKFSVKGKKEGHELHAEYARVTSFLKSPSSTVAGAKKYRKDLSRLFKADMPGASDEEILSSEDVYIRLINLCAEQFQGLLKENYVLIKDKISKISTKRGAWSYEEYISAAADFRDFLEDLYKKKQDEAMGDKKKAAEHEAFRGNLY